MPWSGGSTGRTGRPGAAFTALAVGAPVLLGAVATRGHPAPPGGPGGAGGRRHLDGARRPHPAARGRGDGPGAARAATCPRPAGASGTSAAGTRPTLDEPELARATVESVAENTSDAVVAPLFWGAVAGLPGLLGYRAANTLDAMVGHRSARYARFGTPAARLDDLLNLVPARLTGLLTIAVAPVAHGDRARAWRVWRRDRNDHPSPNAGQCEAAMAGALGRPARRPQRLLRTLRGAPVPRRRPAPEARHLRRAARISGAVGLAALGLAAAYPLTVGRLLAAAGGPRRGPPSAVRVAGRACSPRSRSARAGPRRCRPPRAAAGGGGR